MLLLIVLTLDFVHHEIFVKNFLFYDVVDVQLQLLPWINVIWNNGCMMTRTIHPSLYFYPYTLENYSYRSSYFTRCHPSLSILLLTYVNKRFVWKTSMFYNQLTLTISSRVIFAFPRTFYNVFYKVRKKNEQLLLWLFWIARKMKKTQ